MRDELEGDFNLGINDTVGIAQDCGAKFTSSENRNQSKKCCDIGQIDIFSRIELNPSFVLSSDNTNCKNDIQ